MLVRPGTTTCTPVNLTAYAAWLVAGAGAREDEVVAALADAFAMDPRTIDSDVRHVLADLVAGGLLVRGTDDRPPQPPRADCAADDPRGRPPQAHLDHAHLPLEESRCQATVDALPWSDTLGVAIGRFVVGVRTDAPATAVVVRHLLAAHIVDEPDAPPNFSLVLEPPAEGSSGFRRRGLFEGRTWMTSSEDPAVILSTLVARIDALAPTPLAHVRLAAVAVVHEGDAVLLPLRRGAPMPATASWRARGFTVADAPILLHVDPRGLTVTNAPSGVTIDPGIARRVGIHGPSTARVRAVVLPRVPATQSEACAALVPFVLTAPDDASTEILDRLAALVPAIALRPLDATELDDGVATLLS